MSLAGPAYPTDVESLDIGPLHWSLPGPFRLRLEVDGDMISSARVETGFAHKSIEKILAALPWSAGIPLVDRMDPEAAVFPEHAYCMAIEELLEVVVPERARAIRMAVSELSRVLCHLGYVSQVARAVGSEAMTHFVLRDRERILDLFELLSGARFTVGFLRVGGVASDVSEGFIERSNETCDLLRLRLKEYNEVLTYNQVFLQQCGGLATITHEQARIWGLTGPNARAVGRDFDVRKRYPYCGYDKVDFIAPIGCGEAGALGDAHDRYLLRLREISESLDIIRQALENLPEGPFSSCRLETELRVPVGEAMSRVESPRGLLSCYLVSDGGSTPCRVQFRGPSSFALAALPALLEGHPLGDLPLLVASLGINVTEVDK